MGEKASDFIAKTGIPMVGSSDVGGVSFRFFPLQSATRGTEGLRWTLELYHDDR